MRRLALREIGSSDSLVQSVVTHRDSMAIAAAACQAYAVARTAAAPAGAPAPLQARLALCADLGILLDGLWGTRRVRDVSKYDKLRSRW